MSRQLVLACALLGIASSSFAAGEGGQKPPDQEAAEIEKARPDDDRRAPSGLTLSANNRSVRGLETTPGAKGSVKVDLEGRFTHALVLRVAPDGSRTVECVDSPAHLAELLDTEAEEAEAGRPEGN